MNEFLEQLMTRSSQICHQLMKMRHMQFRRDKHEDQVLNL